jgi:hypothetical protein
MVPPVQPPGDREGDDVRAEDRGVEDHRGLDGAVAELSDETLLTGGVDRRQAVAQGEIELFDENDTDALQQPDAGRTGGSQRENGAASEGQKVRFYGHSHNLCTKNTLSDRQYCYGQRV